jgi:hypothetical protein
MNKDIIYIDVDDDITSIIGKVKGAKNKVVALVPPKRTGVLQSAVNLRLLARAAQQSGKHLVLISGNSALGALAAAASIPVARNLQSKPEIAESTEEVEDEGEDIIDGAELPIGDHARTGDDAAAFASPTVDGAIADNVAEETPRTIPSLPLRQSRRAAGQRSAKIPNFDTFRKRLALGIGAGVLLIGFLVWATWFAPNARILITARTVGTSANSKVTFVPDGKTDMTAGTLKAARQQIKKEISTVTFDATGSKTVGEKAKGEVFFQNCESNTAVTVPAGTGVSAGGLTYITQAAVTVPGATPSWPPGCTPGVSSAVAVVAQDIGDEYDADEGIRFNVAGHSNSSTTLYFRAVADDDITGGSKRTITVVSKADVQKAADQAAGQNNDAVKKQLAGKFGSDAVGIDQTFGIDQAELKSNPVVDAEAPDGKAQLSGSLAFTMLGVEKSEAGRFLDAHFAKQLEGKNDQRVYDNGASKISFVDVVNEGGKYAGTLVATAKIGPKIEDKTVKSEARGKRYGDVQSNLGRIPGVENVDIKFSPFWVRTVPNDEKRISIEFKLDESK